MGEFLKVHGPPVPLRGVERTILAPQAMKGHGMALQAKYGSAAPSEVDAGALWKRIVKRLKALGVEFDAQVGDADLLSALADFLEAIPDDVKGKIETAAEFANSARAVRSENGRAEVILLAAREYDRSPTLQKMTSKAAAIDDTLRETGCTLLTKTERAAFGG